jgi:aminocarboxymuconate-semialdehyde decarboxylase
MAAHWDLLNAASSFAGLIFCGCGVPIAADIHRGPARLPVMVRGKRIKTVDVHAHCYFQEALDIAGVKVEQVVPPVKGIPEHFIAGSAIEKRLAEMDAMAIDMEILSINPFWYRYERYKVEAICKSNNEKLAELCARHSDRFGAFASLPMQFPDLAVQMLETAVRKQGLKGAAIGGSVAGDDFARPKYHPVLQKAEELGAVLFIHPQSTPELAERFRGNGWLANTIGNPLDTTIALQHLIFEGTLDKFPGLKIIAAHGGGFLPSYAMRGDYACFVSPTNCDPDIKLKKKPSEYLNQLYYDAMVFSGEGLRHLVAQVGASQLMLGTDHPIPWETAPVDHVMGAPISEEEKIAILGQNAAKLFGLKSG